MPRRKKRGAFGNHPVAVALWWLWTVVLVVGSFLATVWLARLLVALVWFSLVNGPGPVD